MSESTYENNEEKIVICVRCGDPISKGKLIWSEGKCMYCSFGGRKSGWMHKECAKKHLAEWDAYQTIMCVHLPGWKPIPMVMGDKLFHCRGTVFLLRDKEGRGLKFDYTHDEIRINGEWEIRINGEWIRMRPSVRMKCLSKNLSHSEIAEEIQQKLLPEYIPAYDERKAKESHLFEKYPRKKADTKSKTGYLVKSLKALVEQYAHLLTDSQKEKYAHLLDSKKKEQK